MTEISVDQMRALKNLVADVPVGKTRKVPLAGSRTGEVLISRITPEDETFDLIMVIGFVSGIVLVLLEDEDDICFSEHFSRLISERFCEAERGLSDGLSGFSS